MPVNQRSLKEINITALGVTDPFKWSGQAATFFFSGNFAGGVISVEISPDKIRWFDPLDNTFDQHSVRTLTCGTGQWIRLNALGPGTPAVLCQVSGEPTDVRG